MSPNSHSILLHYNIPLDSIKLIVDSIQLLAKYKKGIMQLRGEKN
jgi:hypothetical protein